MPYEGVQLMQRVWTDMVANAINDDGEFVLAERKVEGTAVIIGESHCYVGAYHDNLDEHGKVWSRDCGGVEISIPASLIGTETEWKYRTASHDDTVYLPVAKNSANAMANLYSEPWVFPDGAHENRQWQAWESWKSGWVTWPWAWVWHHDAVTGKPMGPWVQAGRYLPQAIRAVANWHHFIKQDLTLPQALAEAERLAEIYRVTDSRLSFSSAKGVYWIYPPAPKDPPADPAAAYPKRNDGRSYLTQYAKARAGHS